MCLGSLKWDLKSEGTFVSLSHSRNQGAVEGEDMRQSVPPLRITSLSTTSSLGT